MNRRRNSEILARTLKADYKSLFMYRPTELLFTLYKIPLLQDLDPSEHLLHPLHEERFG